ncbi:hypothetical protein [Nocardioides sp. InS609-2]|uniref:hypothetical protein n=1 Tax=Nocardioides sp. InS609-2 TaxID=2760705 RepID=UPI0020BDDFE3|nr:hypothetical protein [Nocardioides sp. InS609-2]
MDEKDSERARSWLEAAQQALGVTCGQAVSWLGPGVASLWFWTGIRSQSKAFPDEPPLAWASRITGTWGISPDWANSAGQWLHAHDLHRWWLTAAVLLACYAAGTPRTGGALVSMSTLAMMGAFETTDPQTTLIWFTASTAVFCLIAVVLDAVDERQPDSNYISIPQISTTRWISGPGWVIAAMFFLPLLLLVGAVQAFRVTATPPVRSQPTGAIPRRAHHVSEHDHELTG